MADPPVAPPPSSSPSSSHSSSQLERTLSGSSHDPRLKIAPAGDPTDAVKAEGGAQQPEHSRQEEPSKEQSPPETGTRRIWRWTKRTVSFLIEQWFIIGIGVVIGLAAAFPNVARPNGVLEAQWSIRLLCVAIIFFIAGLTYPLRNLYISVGNWKLHLVCHITNFLLFPTIVFAIVSCVHAADPNYERFHPWALVGLVVLGCVPTTVSSNVVMTGQAGGDEAATTIEVMLGNLVGTFLTPALLQMFLSGDTWSFGKPVASGGGGTTELYRRVIEQLGYSVFIPLFVGEVIQFLFPKQTKWVRTTFRIGKIGTFCLLLVIWSTFSGAFYEGAFEILTGEAVALLVGLNVFLYLIFSIFLFLVCRLVPTPKVHVENRKLIRDGKGPMFSPEHTISAMFTGAAKGAALGAPIVAVLYSGLDGEAQGIVSLPLVLYQGSQVVMGQITVAILKSWNKRVKRKEALEAEAKGEVKA
ncbi:hypothetical protein JCM11251_004693 [Rhodosporidiobolus azoricus]